MPTVSRSRESTATAPFYGEHRVFGPFYRSAAGDTGEMLGEVLRTGELWGRPPRYGIHPAVQAHTGPLPDEHVGFEFYSFAQPDFPYGHMMFWRVRDDGSVWLIDDTVRIKVLVTRVQQEIR